MRPSPPSSEPSQAGCNVDLEPIRVGRIELVPATIDLLEAELDSNASLGIALGASVPPSWPPGEYDRSALGFFRSRLSQDPAARGWYSWYALERSEGPRALIGAAGYLGPPEADGTVEVGYSIAPEFQARGFATEIVRALLERAWLAPEVSRVIAHTEPGNAGSIKVLERCGFRRVPPARATRAAEGPLEYEIGRPFP